MRRAELARERLGHELGRNPTPAEIARALKLPVEVVLEAMESHTAGFSVSLDDRAGEEDSQSVADTLGELDPRFESVELNDYLKRELSKLTEQERRVIIARFVGERSQRDIAQELGVSQMYVSRLERRVLSRLREAYDAQ